MIKKQDQTSALKLTSGLLLCFSVWGYRAGSLTLYVLNLHTGPVNVSLPQFADQAVDLFLLTPPGDGQLKSRYVMVIYLFLIFKKKFF